MKRLILGGAICLVLVGAGVFATEKAHRAEKATQTALAANVASAPTTRPTTQESASDKPINKYCAVNRDDEIDPKVTTVYKGKTIGFCCEDCIPKFKKDPEKYMKDLK